MESEAAGELTQTNSLVQEQVTTISKNFTKMEKYVSNLAALQQKMTERMEMIETQYTKMTMKYNGFREDYKRLINEQVDMRTASHKDEFISLDELRSVKIAIKEIDIKMKSKVDNAVHLEECTKREQAQKEVENRFKDDLDKMRAQNQLNIVALRKTGEKTQNSLLMVKDETIKLIEESDNNGMARIEEILEMAKELRVELQQSRQKSSELENSLQGRLLALEQQFKGKKQDETKKFTDFQKRVSQNDKKLRAEISERIESLSIAMESLAARESSNSDKQLKDLSSLKVITNQISDTLKANERKFQQQHDLLDGSIEGLRELYNTEHSQIVAQMSNIIDKLEMIKSEHTSLTERMSKLSHGGKDTAVSGSRKKNNSVLAREAEEETVLTGRESIHQRKMSGTRAAESVGKESIDKNGLTIDGETPFQGKSRQSMTPGNEPELVNNMQSFQSTLKNRVSELEVSTNILREMLQTKVNQSQVLKLQESKCNKYTFKDLVSKLQILKSVLQRTIPNCDGLKQLNFDDTGICYATLSRLSTIRSKQQNRPEDSSKSKQKEKNKEAEKRPPSTSRLPNMLSRSRKRYLTFFDRSECHTVQEVRPVSYL